MTITLKQAQEMIGKSVLAGFNNIVFYAVVMKTESWRGEYRVWFGPELYCWRVRHGELRLLSADDYDASEGFVRLEELDDVGRDR
jgi:hypothetical protein